MAKTFMDMVKEAQSETTAVTPQELQTQLAEDPNILVIDVRDASDISASGIIPGGVGISLGTLGYKGDPTMPDALQHSELGDMERPIAVTCARGAMASMGAKLLQDMGYKNVTYVAGGTNAWKDAGLDVEDFSG